MEFTVKIEWSFFHEKFKRNGIYHQQNLSQSSVGGTFDSNMKLAAYDHIHKALLNPNGIKLKGIINILDEIRLVKINNFLLLLMLKPGRRDAILSEPR